MRIREDLRDLPPYVPGRYQPGAVKMASNENPWGPSPLALGAIRSELERLHIYPEGSSLKLREAIAENLAVSPDQILAGNGSDEVLTLIAGAYIRPGLNGVTSENTFSEYQFSVRLFGGRMKFAPQKKGFYDLDAIAGLVDEDTRLVFLCNPNNPTGTYVPGADLEAFLSRMPDTLLVVLDEAYCHYATAADFPSSLELLGRYPNLVILRTFSKIYGLASLRVGFAVARPEIIRDLLVVKQPFNVGSLAQAGAAAALKDVDFVGRSRAANEEGRILIETGLSELGLSFLPTQANFIAIHVRTDAAGLFRQMMALGVTIRPLASFGLPDWIRVTIGKPEHNELFLRALRDVLVPV